MQNAELQGLVLCYLLCFFLATLSEESDTSINFDDIRGKGAAKIEYDSDISEEEEIDFDDLEEVL